MNKIILIIFNRFIISTTKKNLMYQIINILDSYLIKELVYKFGPNNTSKFLKSQVHSLEVIKIKTINE